MPEGTPKPIKGKTTTTLTMKIGSHPIVYSVMVILAAGAVIFFFAIVPLVRLLQPGGSASVSDAKAKNEAVKSRLDSEKKVIGTVATISESDRRLLSYALPAEADTPGLAVQLNAIAVKSGVKLSSLDMTVPAEAAGVATGMPLSVQPLDIVMSIDNAPYDKMKIFLFNLQNSLRLIDVRTLTFAPSADTVSVEARTYFITSN
jgi:Tfp pilus assembly protein PilO